MLWRHDLLTQRRGGAAYQASGMESSGDANSSSTQPKSVQDQRADETRAQVRHYVGLHCRTPCGKHGAMYSVCGKVRSTDCTAAGLASGAGAAERDLGGGRRGPVAAEGRFSCSRRGAVIATGGRRQGAEWRRGAASPAARVLGDAAGLAIHRQHGSGELEPAILKV